MSQLLQSKNNDLQKVVINTLKEKERIAMKTLIYGVIAMVLALSTGVDVAQGAGTKCKTAEVKSAEVPDISLPDLKKAIAEKSVFLIDCNGSKSYAAGHIPGAVHFATSGKSLGKMLPEDKSALVVAYCGSPRCLAYKGGVNAAKKLGYTNVKHFSKGIKGWKAAGESVEKAPAE